MGTWIRSKSFRYGDEPRSRLPKIVSTGVTRCGHFDWRIWWASASTLPTLDMIVSNVTAWPRTLFLTCFSQLSLPRRGTNNSWRHFYTHGGLCWGFDFGGHCSFYRVCIGAPAKSRSPKYQWFCNCPGYDSCFHLLLYIDLHCHGTTSSCDQGCLRKLCPTPTIPESSLPPNFSQTESSLPIKCSITITI